MTMRNAEPTRPVRRNPAPTRRRDGRRQGDRTSVAVGRGLWRGERRRPGSPRRRWRRRSSRADEIVPGAGPAPAGAWSTSGFGATLAILPPSSISVLLFNQLPCTAWPARRPALTLSASPPDSLVRGTRQVWSPAGLFPGLAHAGIRPSRPRTAAADAASRYRKRKLAKGPSFSRSPGGRRLPTIG